MISVWIMKGILCVKTCCLFLKRLLVLRIEGTLHLGWMDLEGEGGADAHHFHDEGQMDVLSATSSSFFEDSGIAWKRSFHGKISSGDLARFPLS